MSTLKRTLGTFDLTLLVVGLIIGSGIFLVPSSVLRQVGGSVGAAFGVWIVGGVLSVLGALTYAELGAMDRSSGGLYAYIRDAFGRLPAFLYGWTLFFVIATGTNATLVVAAANYMGQFVELSPIARKIVAVSLLAIMGGMTFRGTRGSVSVQNVSALIKVGAIVIVGALLLLKGNAAAVDAASVAPPTSASLISGVGLAIIAVLWAYEGWQYLTFAAGEAVEPQRTVPRAIWLGTAIVMAIYLFANMAYLAALGPERMAASERVAGEAVAVVLGPAMANLIAVAIIISMFSAALSTMITAPRVYFSMARDGLFFRKLAEVHPRFGTPAFAIAASTLWSMVLAASGTFEQLLTYVIFVGWIFYALGAASVLVLRRTRPNVERPFKVPGYPLTPLLFIISGAAIVVNTVFSQPRQAAIGIGMVLLGLPAYLFWMRRAPTT
jgi:APA family basic amino acid/polyamine antiporter